MPSVLNFGYTLAEVLGIPTTRWIKSLILSCCFSIGICFPLSAQALTENTENISLNSCVLHLDKPFYVNGEIVWYKLYLPQELRQAGAIIKVQLCDAEGSVLKDHCLQLTQEAYTFGYLQIPYDWASAVYHLIISTHRQGTHQYVQLADIPLPIYHDSDIPLSSSKHTVDSLSPSISAIDRQQALRIFIEMEKTAYQAGETVTVKLRLTDAQGDPLQAHASVAVRDQGILGDEVMPNVFEGIKLNAAFPLDTLMHIQATFIDTLNRLLASGTMVAYLPYHQQVIAVQYSPPETYSLPLPKLYGSQALQFVDTYHPHAVLKLKAFAPTLSHPPLNYSPAVIRYLHDSRQRKKMYQLFRSIESELKADFPRVVADSFAYDRKYYMKDYESFPDLPTFLQEILTPLKARRTRKDGIVYKMLNTTWKHKSLYPEQPIFIVNQYIITDKHIINDLTYKEIEYIEMFNDYKGLIAQFGAMGSNGVVKIQTTQDLTFLEEKGLANTFNIHTLQLPAKFPLRENQPRHLPNVRPQLYWNPSIHTEANGRATFSFRHSDDLGSFQIEVVAQDEQGHIGRAVVVYEGR